ncbi:MAG TPA: hypothetical protein VFL17_04415 [Anaerolineae bacterium]|nr:hypothetical protein [Anaerolineae bacterium]
MDEKRRKRLKSVLTPPRIVPAPAPLAPRWPLYAGVALAIGLTSLLYLNTLSLPFFQDDVIHIRWLSTRSLADPFLTAENLPTYRPLGESLMKLWWSVLGRHDPVTLRLQNILTHALNATLVALLALRLDRSARRYVVGGVAAALFAAFPFAYQAVVWINVFFYPLGTLLLLLAALSYWQARTAGSIRWLLVAWLMCFLAPAEIEWGLMSGALLVGVELVLWAQRRQARPWLIGPAIGLAINAVFFAIWQIVPKFDYSGGMRINLEAMLQMSTYYLQGLIYPSAPLAVPLVGLAGLDDLNAVRWVALATLMVVLSLLIWRRRLVLAMAALGWFALLVFPTLVTVDFDYVINSPRLLYPAAVGIVILWAAWIAEFTAPGRWRPARMVIAAGAFGLALAQNVAFVQLQNRLYHLAEAPVHALAAAARAAEDGEVPLFVNLPSWLAPHWRDYAIGNHGVQFITGYAGIDDVIFAYNGADRFSRAVSFTNVMSITPYWLGLYGPKLDWQDLARVMEQSDPVFLTTYDGDGIRLRPAGRVKGVPQARAAARFGDTPPSVELGAALVTGQDKSIDVELNWRVLSSIDRDLSVFVHLYAPDGRLVAQADGYPLLGLSPFWLWEPGQTLLDMRSLAWPAGASPGEYRIGVGVYDRASGERLAAFEPDGSRLPDGTFLVATLGRP